jgi:putative transposase
LTILPLLLCLQPILANTSLRQLAIISDAIFSLSGPVTMLGISRLTNKGGSYRTIQRFFASTLPWLNIFWLLFRKYLYQTDEIYLLAGDETVVTKAGHHTHGLDRFFASLLGKPVPGLAFFALSLLAVKGRRSYPISIQQIVRTQEEKAAAKERSKARKNKLNNPTKKASRPVGRPKGSKNKDKNLFSPTPELRRIDAWLGALLQLFGAFLPLTYLVLDGHFGHPQALLMAKKNGLQLISKLHHNAALVEKFEGEYSGKGKPSIYGARLDYEKLAQKYLKKTITEKAIQTRYYQGEFLHKDFPQALNVVIMVKTNLRTQKQSKVNLFSSDLSLGWQEVVDYYSLRFQIEFNFRDAKQHFGLEDFMNLGEEGVRNAANLSFLCVTLSQVLLKEQSRRPSLVGILDLKAYFRGLRYAQESLKWLLEKPAPILMEEILEKVGSLGRIHSQKATTTSS